MTKKPVLIIALIILLSLSLFSGGINIAHTSTEATNEEIEELNKRIDEKKQKIKQIEDTIGEYKQKISQTRLEAVSLSNQISILDNHLAQVELDIKATENKLDILNLEIQATDLSISEKEKNIELQKSIIAELIRTIRENDDKNYIEIISAYDFSDFYNQVQYIKTIEQDLGQSAKSLRIAKEELELKKKQKEEIKASYTKVNEQLAQKKKDLEEQTAYKGTLLANTHSSELKYKTLVTGLQRQYQQIETEISETEKEVRKKLEAQNKISQSPEDAEGLLSWPTQSRYLTSIFHDPDYPYRNVFEHTGIDIRSSQGTPVKATASGYIAVAKRCTLLSCYSYIMIVHSGGISTVYGHLSAIKVTQDQFVARGDVIGLSGGRPGTAGSGPFCTGPHLHFEVRKNGIPTNPLGYLVKDY